MGMGQQLSPHFLKQSISLRSVLAAGNVVDQRRHYLMVIVQILQDAFCDAEHFFNHREYLSLRGTCWVNSEQLLQFPSVGKFGWPQSMRALWNRTAQRAIVGFRSGLLGPEATCSEGDAATSVWIADAPDDAAPWARLVPQRL